MIVRGTPRELDAFLRPAMRITQLAIGVTGSAILICLGSWWYAPLPLALSFLFYEWFFSSRSDRPLQLTFGPERVVVDDPFLKRRHTLEIVGVDSALAIRRRLDDGRVEVVVVLAAPDGYRAAFQIRLRAEDAPAAPTDVDADLCNLVLGSISGLARGVAPREVILRQVVEDRRVLPWLREHLPASAWDRPTVRFWRGTEPALDLFGYFADAPTGRLRLEPGHAVWIEDGTETRAPWNPGPPRNGHRIAVLFRMASEGEVPEGLPLWLMPFGDRQIAIPAPIAASGTADAALTPELCHVHAPEGAILLWTLWRSVDPAAWPQAWHDALATARPHADPWPAAIPDPQGGPSAPGLLR